MEFHEKYEQYSDARLLGSQRARGGLGVSDKVFCTPGCQQKVLRYRFCVLKEQSQSNRSLLLQQEKEPSKEKLPSSSTALSQIQICSPRHFSLSTRPGGENFRPIVLKAQN